MKRFQHALLASGLLLLAAAPAPAWEWSYGPPNTIDDAFRRVHPVPACAPFGAGYIAVGTQDAGFGNPDVYVVHTDLLGNSAARWEATYDIQGLGLQDEGMAIVSIPNQGYVFLSNSFNGVWRPALTFIDCKGSVIWSRIYLDVITPGGGLDLVGRDLIRAQTGNPNFLPATNPGDLVVAGEWWNGLDDDAFLMRTNPIGNIIWNIAHNTALPEGFNAVAEALPVGAEPAGDLVAVGWHKTAAGDPQALVARVSGNNGVIGAAPQCFQHHGANGTAEVYNSVTRLANFFPGQFAFVGTTTNPVAGGWQEDIWVTRGNTCALNAQARFGNPGAITSEHGNDIIEVLAAKPGAPAGSLAIAGDHGPIGGPYDAALMLLNPGLVPLAGQHRIFGDFGPFDETFFSLAEDPAGWPTPPGPGYILAGLTQTPWAAGDPQDMYLVHDDPAVIVCEKPWNPVRVATNWPQQNLPSQPRRPARFIQVPTPWVLQLSGQQICAP